MILRLPKRIQAELNTHRSITKSSASARAIPFKRMVERVLEDPCTPISWGRNQKGMQEGEPIHPKEAELCRYTWEGARDEAVRAAQSLHERGIHKQIVNRLIEPFVRTEVVVTATDWGNFFGLRCHPAAEPHFQEAAYAAREAYEKSTPQRLAPGQWHLPFLTEEDNALPLEIKLRASAGRVARVSYLNHEGKRDIDDDMNLFSKLTGTPKHATPLEAVASAMDWPRWYLMECGGRLSYPTVYALREAVVARRRERLCAVEDEEAPRLCELHDEAALGQLTSGNFVGWQQFRKTYEDENIGGLMP